MKNFEIKSLMLESGLRQWEVAKLLGIHESVLCRWMRDTLNDEQREKIKAAIKRHADGGEIRG